MMFLSLLFRFFVRQGTLRVIDAEGKTHVFKGKDGPNVTIKLHDKKIYMGLLLFPHMHIAESYMEGTLTVEQGSLYDFLHLLALNQVRIRRFPSAALIRKIFSLFSFMIQHNPVGKTQKKIAHHYDISNEIYRLFLDQDMQYSCAYFKDEKDSLAQAQQQKKDHILSKLRLEKGQKVLDIGCGWGGLAIEIAKKYDVHVTGVTLSQEQYSLARKRVQELGLESRISILLQDYREIDQTFDRIVSIGMFEHVGKPHYKEFFNKVQGLLADDGFMLLHSIGHNHPIRVSNPWINKYIFPGCYVPALSECLPDVEKAGFWVTDLEILHKHYSYTLRAWKENFVANKQAVLAIKDDVFFRMFEFYLTSCEIAFMYGELMVFQMQLNKDSKIAPLTRDYMYSPLPEKSL